MAGLVVSVRTGKTQKGRMGSVLFDDRTGRIEVAVFAPLFDQVRNLLVPDQILVATASLSFDDYRDVKGIRIPFTAVVRRDNAVMFERTITDVQINVAFPPTFFLKVQ